MTLARRQVIGGLGLALGAPASARSKPAVATRLSAAFPASGPGAVAIGARGDRLVVARAYGLAQMELRAPMRTDSVLRIASLTKQFTAVAVLKLVEAGRLRLEAPLASAWGEAPTGWREITPRQLLSHTSGLTDDMSPIFREPRADRTPDQLLAPYRDRAPMAPPGATWRYSNLNYWILGKVLETVSGQPYGAHIMQQVLIPGMTRTRYGVGEALTPGRAPGYEAAGADWRNARPFSPTLGYAAGGFLSSPVDVAHWYAALGRGEIVGPRLLDLAGQEVRTDDGKPTGYGLGWYVSQVGDARVLHHGGSSVGYSAYVFWVPSGGLFAGLFRNCSGPPEPKSQARALLASLWDKG